MVETIENGSPAGFVVVPASKSHTIRALLIATLADGESRIHGALESRDAASCALACRMLGAQITVKRSNTGNELIVRGVAGKPRIPDNVIDVGNSGTTLFLTTSVAALADGWTVFTGDAQTRRRSAEPLLQTLNALGAKCFTTRNNGCAPYCIHGPMSGGNTSISCPTSQYLSSLLLALPLARKDSKLTVPLLNERPYVEMTLKWLTDAGIRVRREGWSKFFIAGGQSYAPFEITVPGDFSSATFFFCAAAVAGTRIVVENLDRSDTQGDKEVLGVLEQMGCTVEDVENGIAVTGPRAAGKDLVGGVFDLNSMPDALPALAATACYAEGTTKITNVPQAREKETDRIAVMTKELRAMGAKIEEDVDGLTIEGTPLTGSAVGSHDDHRVAMALAIAALGASGPTRISGAECAAVTYPGFFDELRRLSSIAED
ncbi:MAG: 3-phosphoshikimate 1-carboxyvinyltransferase [Spirochaetaceae bacterium]|nr:MAG: 3-phosphoshikimate 1-carboxyvinyltransferase [Spirochaetaceae bacterium]